MFTYLQGKIATSGERGAPGAIPRSNEAWDGQFWDAAKLQALARAQNPGGDGRTVANDQSWMQALNPLSGITVRDQARAGYTRYGDTDEEVAGTDAVYTDKLGRTYRTVKGDAGDPNTYIQFNDTNGAGFENPTGSKRDRVAPIYKLNADGTATPHSANTNYREGAWSRDGQELATWAAIMATAGIGGAALEAGSVGAEGLSGMDLAADAAAGTGNNTYAAGSQFSGGAGGGGYGGDGYGDTWTGGEGGGGDVGGGNVDTSGTNMFEGGQSAPNYSAGDTWTSAGTTGSDNGQWINGFNNKDIVSGVAQVGSAYMQNEATKKAIKAQEEAARNSNALQLLMYNQTRQDNAPWRAAGENALAKLTGLLNDGSLTSRFAGKLDNEPGYQFAKQEGMRAIDNSASARGGIGGAALKAGARFAENNANQFYNDSFNRWNTENTGIYNRLSNAAGLGQQANALVGAAGQNYGNQVGNNMTNLGNAQGAAAINQGNIYGNLLNQGAAWGNQNNWWQG